MPEESKPTKAVAQPSSGPAGAPAAPAAPAPGSVGAPVTDAEPAAPVTLAPVLADSDSGILEDAQKEQTSESTADSAECIDATAAAKEEEDEEEKKQAAETTETATGVEQSDEVKADLAKVIDEEKPLKPETVNKNTNETSTGTRSKCKAATFNPITGEAYNKTEATATTQPTAQPTSNVRVRQPPGGQSTKLW